MRLAHTAFVGNYGECPRLPIDIVVGCNGALNSGFKVFHIADHRCRGWVVSLYRVADLRLHGDTRLDIHLTRVLQIVQSNEIQRVRHGNRENAVLNRQRQNLMLYGKVFWEQAQGVFLRFHRREVNERHVQLSSKRVGKHLLVDQPAVDQEFTDPLPGARVFINDAFNLLARHYAALYKKVAYTFAALIRLK